MWQSGWLAFRELQGEHAAADVYNLKVGETLKTLEGTTVVESIDRRPDPERVCNIEVKGDHVYRVGTSGVLVHNASGNIVEDTANNSPTYYKAEDCTNSKCFIIGRLSQGGQLEFSVIAKPDDGSECQVRGHEFFGAMMAHFGTSVTTIRGRWLDLEPYADNLNIFNGCMAQKNDEIECAKETKTGQWAVAAGYNVVDVVFKDGSSPNFIEVYAVFSK